MHPLTIHTFTYDEDESDTFFHIPEEHFPAFADHLKAKGIPSSNRVATSGSVELRTYSSQEEVEEALLDYAPNLEAAPPPSSTTKDSLGTVLNDGDSIKVIKDLKVSGCPVTIKQGQTVKKIRLTGNPEEIDCKVEGIKMTLKTCFVRKTT